MSQELKLAFAVSAGIHAWLAAGLPVTRPAAFDVERAPTSLEIYVIAPQRAPVAERTQADPPEPPDAVAALPPDPAPRTLIAPERRGALTEVLPAYLRNPAPVYPRLAQERGDQGTMVLDVEVLPSGRCGGLRVTTSSGHAILDDAAVRAVQRWRFSPATRWGSPVALWVEIPVTFRLIEEKGR